MKNKLKEYWSVGAVLGKGPFFSQCMLWLTLLSVPIRKRLPGLTPVTLPLVYNGKFFYFSVRDGADIAVLREMFVEKEYVLSASCVPKKIIDIGSHIGASVAFFACTYPDAHITAYEPDPDNFKLLQENMRQFSQVTCVATAVSAKSGSTTFFKNKNSSISSSLISRSAAEEEIIVRTLSLDSLLEKSEVDLIKFDVEGGEYEIFSASNNIAHCPAYIGEVHYDLIHKSREEVLQLFQGYTHTEQKVSAQRSIMAFYTSAT